MIIDLISNYFQDIHNSVPDEYKVLISLLFYTIFIVIYAVFIWKFYKFLAKRDIFQLNLRQYDYSKYPTLEKFAAVFLYTIEYLVILPFLVLFWFTIFSLFLLLLSKQSAYRILLISTAIIASTRITAYTSENLSRDIAKIFPFTVLVLFLLEPDFFNVNTLLEKIKEVPSLFNQILVFIIFIFAVEFALRGIYLIALLFQSSEESKSKED